MVVVAAAPPAAVNLLPTATVPLIATSIHIAGPSSKRKSSVPRHNPYRRPSVEDLPSLPPAPVLPPPPPPTHALAHDHAHAHAPVDTHAASSAVQHPSPEILEALKEMHRRNITIQRSTQSQTQQQRPQHTEHQQHRVQRGGGYASTGSSAQTTPSVSQNPSPTRNRELTAYELQCQRYAQLNDDAHRYVALEVAAIRDGRFVNASTPQPGTMQPPTTTTTATTIFTTATTATDKSHRRTNAGSLSGGANDSLRKSTGTVSASLDARHPAATTVVEPHRASISPMQTSHLTNSHRASIRTTHSLPDVNLRPPPTFPDVNPRPSYPNAQQKQRIPASHQQHENHTTSQHHQQCLASQHPQAFQHPKSKQDDQKKQHLEALSRFVAQQPLAKVHTMKETSPKKQSFPLQQVADDHDETIRLSGSDYCHIQHNVPGNEMLLSMVEQLRNMAGDIDAGYRDTFVEQW